jgi:Na+/proline symporter
VMVTDILQFVILTVAVFILLPLSLAKVGGFEKFTQSGSSSHLVKVRVWVVILKNGLSLPFAFQARLRTT